MMMVGLPGLNFESFITCWIAIFLYGSGLGLTIPAINLLTIEVTPIGRQSSSINLINFAWGIGALSSYPFVATFSKENSLVIATASLVVALLILAICFVSSRASANPHAVVATPDDLDDSIWRHPASWLFVLFGFFVIGIESSMGGWLTTYTKTFGDSLKGVNLTVVYFAFLIFGRGLASIVSRRLNESTLISICTMTLLIGISLLVFFADSLSIVGAAIAGLGSSAIFPTNMVRFTKVFGPRATRNATPVFIAGTCGSAVVSWLIGQISTSYGGLRFGIAVLLVAAVLVLTIQIAIVYVFGNKSSHRSVPPA
jgi:fucose permease